MTAEARQHTRTDFRLGHVGTCGFNAGGSRVLMNWSPAYPVGNTTGVVRLPIASCLPPHLSSVTPPTLTTTVVSKHTRRHTDAALGPFLSLKLLLLNFAGRVGAGVVPLDCCAHT